MKYENGVLTISVPNTEYAKLLMLFAKTQVCVVSKYYWVSRYDESIISEIEPKIDAYDCVVELKGNPENLLDTLSIYSQNKNRLNGLTLNEALSKDDIRNLACKMINFAEFSC